MSDSGAENTIVVGDDKKVSLQVYQDIYNSITGKTEILSRMFFDAQHVRLADLERLHREFAIQLEQYDCKVTSCHVSVRYCDGKSEGFSAFNRFKLHGANKPVPTESIDVEYDFLILLPKTDEAKPYKLVVGVRSTLGVVERLTRTQATETEKNLFFSLDRGTARMELHYVDMAVARTLEALVEDWYKSLLKQGSNTRRTILKYTSLSVPSLARVSLVLSSALLSYHTFSGSISSNLTLFEAGLASAAGLSMAAIIGIPLATHLKQRVDRSMAHSSILISDADQQLLEKAKTNKLKWFCGTAASWIGAIFLGLLTTYLATWIGI